MMREGLSLLLEAEERFVVVGEDFHRAAIERGVEQLRPDILLLDTSLMESGEIVSVASLQELSPETRIIMLASLAWDESVHRFMNEGACGYISKQAPSSEIPKAIIQVMDGNYYLSPQILNRVVETYLEGTRTKPRGRNEDNHKYLGYNQLSEREREVFYLLLEGKSRKEISEELNISPKTADKHRANIYRKTRVENATQLLHYAMDLNLTRSSLVA